MTPKHLVDPVRLGTHTAPSRVLFGPHETNLARGRAISARHSAYYGRRAAGGAGLVVTEIASVHDSDWPYERAPLATESAAGWSQIVEQCRPHGTVVLAGLGHAGSQGSSAYNQSALWAPSRVPDVASRELPMEMETGQIAELVRAFASSAATAVDSGVHGVEINAGQYSLLRQFLSGLTNTRGDEWGQDKTKLLRDVLAKVRDAIGSEPILGLRLSCDELAPWAGILPEHAEEHVGWLANLVDYLAVVRGSAMGASATRPDLHTEPGFNIELTRRIRSAVADEVPVVLQGSVVDPGQADWAIADGAADVVEMTRAQIADPDLVRKARTDRPIRPCSLDNAKCMVRDNRNPIVTCSAEPRSGHESTDPDYETHDSSPVRALVVGGGPAGLEAARILALRGNHVRLTEREPRLGGALRLASLVGGRARLIGLVEWLAARVHELGVEVHTGVETTHDDVAEADARGERIVLATGSVPGTRDYYSAPEADVIDHYAFYERLRDGAEIPPGPIVVFDPVGGPVGVGTAELVAASGAETALVSPDQVVGTQLAITGDLADANARLQRAEVALHKSSLVREVRASEAVLENSFTGRRGDIACATLIDCGHRLPNHWLWHAAATRAGDCVAPRTVHEAVLDARRAAHTAATARFDTNARLASASNTAAGADGACVR